MRAVLAAAAMLAAVTVGSSVAPAAGDRPSVDQPERVKVPATIVVHRRHAELVRHVLLRDPRNRVASIRVCKLGHTDRQHCTTIPVADIRYGH